MICLDQFSSFFLWFSNLLPDYWGCVWTYYAWIWDCIFSSQTGGLVYREWWKM